jgi:hypothetical protein
MDLGIDADDSLTCYQFRYLYRTNASGFISTLYGKVKRRPYEDL